MQILSLLRRDNRLGVFIALSFSCCLSAALLLARIAHSDTGWFMFLGWNLFLAWIPLALSTLLRLRYERVSSNALFLFGVLAVWLLFFPNAPYIITDLQHLKVRDDAPFWFDLLLIVSFAWNGLMMGLLSLMDVQEVLARRYNAMMAWSASFVFILLGSFGVYLGRFERWNSWDILSHPLSLFADIAQPLLNPYRYPRPVLMTVAYAAFLFVAYLMFWHLVRMQQPRNTSALEQQS